VAWLTPASTEAKAVAQIAPIVVASVLTFLFLMHMSAGLALYSVANSVVSAAERRLAARSLKAR
jgi:membrane protein insertase Oxa1/YidC/SpoIIIJ